MRTVHDLIGRHGVVLARNMADNKMDVLAVSAASTSLATEETRIGFIHAGFAMTALPHKRIDENVWLRKGLVITLVVASGYDDAGQMIGVPHGSLARLILLYLQTEAIRTGNPEVELGGSMKAWLKRMGIGRGGKTYKLVQE